MMVYFGESFSGAMPPSSKKLHLIKFSYQVVYLISVACKVFIDQIERIPAEKYGLVKSFCLSICRESLVHKVADVKLNCRCKSFFLHPRTAITSESEFFSTYGFQFIHNFSSS